MRQERFLTLTNRNDTYEVVLQPKKNIFMNTIYIRQKIFDFLSGATYALNGNVQKVANNIFIFAPESVDIAANQDERGFDFGGGKNPWR